MDQYGHLQHIQALQAHAAILAFTSKSAYIDIIEEYLEEIPPFPDTTTVNCHQWRECRDLALLAVFYGAGVKVSQARRLKRNAIAKSCNFVRVSQGPVNHDVFVEILATSRRALAQWVRLLGRLKVPGECLFPVAPDGRPMHASSIFRRVRMRLEQIGIAEGQVDRLSPQTLRNTYAAIRLDRGEHIDMVGAPWDCRTRYHPCGIGVLTWFGARRNDLFRGRQ
ncbi:tyrosine-type recombinase/integrase [Cupriavidus sp. RAF12]|uniref:tyrosine-type recombinase/integrase n=1 Tax=Cupriavidus sp. RAF12 TaxID=3233050 RepID=UPI003F917877